MFQSSCAMTVSDEKQKQQLARHGLQQLRPLTSYSTPENTTLSRQKELRRFGVPRLQDTLQKYLVSVVPFLTAEQMSRTRQIAAAFGRAGGPAERMQELLEQRARERDNWLKDWWLERAYLGYRESVVVWSSPGMMFPKQNFRSESDQLDYAARIVAGYVDFKIMLDTQCLPLEYQGKSPLDMQQYYVQFGVCRIPGESKDTLSFHPNSKHIVVVHNNEFFRLEVLSNDGVPLCESHLFGCLKYIVEESSSLGKNPHPPGILTSLKRDDWHKGYQMLLPGNEATIRDIQSSLFVLCLDGDLSSISPDDHQARTLSQAIHGNGSKCDSGNRWFDKIMQVFVSKSGESGLTIEHSTAEALAPMTIANHAVHCANGGIKFSESSNAEVALPRHLHFVLTDATKANIRSARTTADALISDLEVAVLHFKSFGKSFVKNHRCSPDSFVQTAMQLAFYRVHGTPAAQYESGALRVFLHGRTDIIRSCTKEAVDFAKKMLSNGASEQERLAALNAALKVHNEYAKMTCDGQGVDRHLLGLRLMASENGVDIPDFYNDTAYTASTYHRISSSQVSGKQEMVVGFGPLVMDGYGCCYNIRDYDLLFGLSAMRSCAETSVQRYKDALQESLHDMHDLVANKSAKL